MTYFHSGVDVGVKKMSSPFAEKLKNIKLNSHVSWFLHFHDPDLSKEYQKFKVAQSNTWAFIPLHFAAVFFHISGSCHGLMLSFDVLNILNVILSIAWTVLLGNWLVIVHWKQCFFKKGGKMCDYLTATYTSQLESLWIISDAVCLSLLLVCMVHNGPCGPDIRTTGKGCNYSGTDNEIPMDLVMTMFFAPIIHAVVLKGASFVSVLIAIGINAMTLFIVMFFHSMTFGGPIIILFCPLCLLVMYEFQRQGISVFLLSQSQAVLMAEIDRLSVQSSRELKSMIGNVAHDLKTPMSAFVSGLDFITSILEEIQGHPQDQETLMRGVRSISESVVNMKNINSFMRMSINRCIDYTKASNGMVLVPHMETVNFREMLQLPLNCMKNLQNDKVTIELLPTSGEIAPFVITDPQWFQENVLCLLSNAVKYSAEGAVTISVQLIGDPMKGEKTDSQSTLQQHSSSQRQPIRLEELEPLISSGKTMGAASASNQMIRVDVEDNGIGVSDEVKAHLFNPFKQAQRLAGGTGLGLYSLAKRMEAMGGRYGVENRYNGKPGSIFWFAVPYRPDYSQSVTTTSKGLLGGAPSTLGLSSGDSGVFETTLCEPTSQPVGPKNNSIGSSGCVGTGVAPMARSASFNGLTDAESLTGKRLNILLVDDSISILKMSDKMLTRLGHTVTTAENGAAALKLMSNQFKRDRSESGGRSNSSENSSDSGLGGLQLMPTSAPFDVVLMDLQMPVMDGLEATKRLRALEAEKNAAAGVRLYHQLIVGVSANSDSDTKQEAYSAGVDEFIPKPFNTKTFEAVYQKLILPANNKQE